MKLKYYLRGLGIGIVVTAVIMTVVLGNKQSMTDEEVIKRAKELGMIENSVLADRVDKDVETADNEATENEVVDDETVDKEMVSEEVTDDEKAQEGTQKEEDSDQTPESEDVKNQESTKKDVVSITIVGGDTSWTVSKRMEEAGLIESAKDFDTHLCRYGYDKRISVGTYDIPKTATHEEMAKIITKMD